MVFFSQISQFLTREWLSKLLLLYLNLFIFSRNIFEHRSVQLLIIFCFVAVENHRSVAIQSASSILSNTRFLFLSPHHICHCTVTVQGTASVTLLKDFLVFNLLSPSWSCINDSNSLVLCPSQTCIVNEVF
jgi:hypothetical protein